MKTLLLLVLTSAIVVAEEAAQKASLQEIVPKCEVYLRAYNANPVADKFPDELKAASSHGARKGINWISTDIIGNAVVRVNYLQRYDTGFGNWELTWYSSDDNGVFILHDIAFSDVIW